MLRLLVMLLAVGCSGGSMLEVDAGPPEWRPASCPVTCAGDDDFPAFACARDAGVFCTPHAAMCDGTCILNDVPVAGTVVCVAPDVARELPICGGSE